MCQLKIFNNKIKIFISFSIISMIFFKGAKAFLTCLLLFNVINTLFLQDVTYQFPAYGIDRISMTSDDYYAVFHSDGILKFYNTSFHQRGDEKPQFEYSNFISRPIEILQTSYDRNFLIFSQGNVICLYNNINISESSCLQNSLPSTKNLTALGFLSSGGTRVIGGLIDQYIIINFSIEGDPAVKNKTEYSVQTNFTVVDFCIDQYGYDLYGILQKGEIIRFSLNISDSQFLNPSWFFYPQFQPSQSNATAIQFNVMRNHYNNNIHFIRFFNNQTTDVFIVRNLAQIQANSSFIPQVSRQFGSVPLSGNVNSFAQFDSTYFFGLDSHQIVQKARFVYLPISNISGLTQQFKLVQHLAKNTTGNTTALLTTYSKNIVIQYEVTAQRYCYAQTQYCVFCFLQFQRQDCMICNYGILNSSYQCEPITCEQGYQPNSQYKACVKNKCENTLCDLCNVSQSCLTCINSPGVINQNGQCLNTTQIETPIQQYSQQISCENLAPNCLRCQFSQDMVPIKCSKCEQNFYLLNNGTCFYVPFLPQIKQAQQAVSAPISFPNIKILIKPLFAFFNFLDDYWYYRYHNRVYQNQTQLCLSTINEISAAKLFPQFIDLSFIDQAVNISHLIPPQQKQYTPTSLTEQDYQDIQFLPNTQEMYKQSYFSIIIVFILTRLLFIIIKNLFKSREGTIKGFLYDFFRENSMYKILFISFIQSNIIYIAFNAGIQLHMPSTHKFSQKMNMIFAICALLIVIVFSLTFYLLLYTWASEKDTKVFLTYNQYSLRGLASQMVINCTRNLLCGIIHSYCIYNYRTQMILLILVKVGMIVSLNFFRTAMQQLGFYLVLHFYFITGILLDIILLLEEQSHISRQNIGTVQVIILGILSILSLWIVVLTAYYPIKQIIIQKISHQVAPQPLKQVNIKQKFNFQPNRLKLTFQQHKQKQNNGTVNKQIEVQKMHSFSHKQRQVQSIFRSHFPLQYQKNSIPFNSPFEKNSIHNLSYPRVKQTANSYVQKPKIRALHQQRLKNNLLIKQNKRQSSYSHSNDQKQSVQIINLGENCSIYFWKIEKQQNDRQIFQDKYNQQNIRPSKRAQMK